MNSKTRNELYLVCKDLGSVINELESLSELIRTDFEGIGNYKCADCIDKSLEKCYYIRRKLYNLDTSSIVENFSSEE